MVRKRGIFLAMKMKMNVIVCGGRWSLSRIVSGISLSTFLELHHPIMHVEHTDNLGKTLS